MNAADLQKEEEARMKKTLKAMILITAASFFLASCGNAGILPGAKNPVTSNYRAAGNADSGSAGTFSAVNGGKSKSGETAAAAADQTANGSSGTETAAETSDSQKLIRTVNFTFTTARLSGIMPAAKDLARQSQGPGRIRIPQRLSFLRIFGERRSRSEGSCRKDR